MRGFVCQFVNHLNFKLHHVKILGGSHVPFGSLMMTFVVILLGFILFILLF